MLCFLAQHVLFAAACWDKSSFRTSGVFGLLCGYLSDSHYRAFFPVCTSRDATLPQKQLRSYACLCLSNRVMQFTQKSATSRTRGDPSNVKQVKGGDGPCGLVGLCLESCCCCHICLWVCDLLWFCKRLHVQTFTNEVPSLLISCGVTLTITNKKNLSPFPYATSRSHSSYHNLSISPCRVRL